MSVQHRVSVGEHFSLFADADGVLYSWGGGDPHPTDPHSVLLHHLCLGIESGSFVPRPQRVTVFDGIAVKQVSAGSRHVLLLAVCGEVYSCGCGDDGRLGHGDAAWLSNPRPVRHFEERHGHVAQISAGDTHSLVITEHGWVYSWGSGANGRHGHGERSNKWYPQTLEHLAEHTIRHVSAGKSHSLAVSQTGEMWAWGSGGSGQLGLGDVDPGYQRRVPTQVELFTEPIVLVSAGAAHSLAVAESGELFSFGLGAFGRLGHGDRDSVYAPKRVEALAGNPVQYAIAGGDHSVVLTERGQVFTFGLDSYGKLGHGTRISPALPRGVRNYLDATLPVEAASEAKDDVQTTYAWGRPEGQVGLHGGSLDLSIGRGQYPDRLLPERIEALLNLQVVEIAAGDRHTIVRLVGADHTSELRAFGSNEMGQLGLPWMADQGGKSLPTRVDGPPAGISR
jgi:alpha-tubulin suppressor-like RCC1 family protein